MLRKKRLVALAEIRKDTTAKIDNLIAELRAKGFMGTPSRATPHHIHLATFPVNDVESVVARLHKATTENHSFEITYECMGIMDDLLLLIPSVNPALTDLRNCIALDEDNHWFPYTPIIYAEPREMYRAVEALNHSFHDITKGPEGVPLRVFIDTIGIYETGPTYLIEKAKLLEPKGNGKD